MTMLQLHCKLVRDLLSTNVWFPLVYGALHVALYPAWCIAASCLGFGVLKPSCPPSTNCDIAVLVVRHFSIGLDHHIECDIFVSTGFHW